MQVLPNKKRADEFACSFYKTPYKINLKTVDSQKFTTAFCEPNRIILLFFLFNKNNSHCNFNWASHNIGVIIFHIIHA